MSNQEELISLTICTFEAGELYSVIKAGIAFRIQHFWSKQWEVGCADMLNDQEVTSFGVLKFLASKLEGKDFDKDVAGLKELFNVCKVQYDKDREKGDPNECPTQTKDI
jgi:hypothetical protein